MAYEPVGGDEVVLTTERLLLRPWRVSEAAVIRQLWQERDLRAPPHRRLDAEGRPTLDDLRRWVRDQRPAALGRLAVQRRLEGDVVGHFGLIVSDHVPADEPEIAFELLRHAWGAGVATEAASAVVEWARSSGHERLSATVREWNTASRRVLAEVGFVETGRVERDEEFGDTIFVARSL